MACHRNESRLRVEQECAAYALLQELMSGTWPVRPAPKSIHLIAAIRDFARRPSQIRSRFYRSVALLIYRVYADSVSNDRVRIIISPCSHYAGLLPCCNHYHRLKDEVWKICNKRKGVRMKWVLTLTTILFMLASCAAPQTQATPIPTPLADPNGMLSEQEAATLGSLELVDDYPLYKMRYIGSYSGRANLDKTPGSVKAFEHLVQGSCQAAWGCSLFATLSDEKNRLFGRNFDWRFSPALLLFIEPGDGYASVSMVDMEYLGFEGDRSRNLIDLSLEERQPLLDAPFLPFDGMNEKGLAVGMAAVPAENMPFDPQKKTIDELRAIREILDHAGTVEEAIDILRSYNINMGNVPLHYLIASASGDSALVEFYKGEMVVFRNESSWQIATNFLLASTNGHPQGQCWRYDRISQRLKELLGRISSQDAFRLLKDVSQDNTQWSIVYHMTSGDMDIVMGSDSFETIHTFHLEQSVR